MPHRQDVFVAAVALRQRAIRCHCQADFVFNMEEEDDGSSRARKRASGGNMGAATPLDWTYASTVATNRNIPGSVNNNTSRNGGSAVEAVGGR